MAFQEINPGIWTYQKDGDSIEGELIAMQTEVGPNKSKLYSIKLKDNTIKNIWGSIILDDRMNLVKIGDVVKITYKGLGEKTKKGKNAPKLFKVEIDIPDNN